MKLSRATALTLLLVCGCSQITVPATPSASAVQDASGSASYKVYTAGKTPGFLASAFALDVASDGNGNLWFTDSRTPAIGRISAAGKVTEYQTGLPSGAKPYSIIRGSGGTMWFSDARGLAIGRVSPTGVITEYSNTSKSNIAAQDIALDQLGRPWIVGVGTTVSTLAYLAKSGRVVTVALPKGLSPDGSLASDASGRLWLLARDAQDNVVAVERVATSYIQVHSTLTPIRDPCCPNMAPKPLVIGPDGNPWFTTTYYGSVKYTGKLIGTVRRGQVQVFIAKRNPGLPSYPSGIAPYRHTLSITGGDPFQSNGAMWCIQHDGSQTVNSVAYNPIALTVDSNGNAWFSAYFSGGPSQIVKALQPLSSRCTMNV